MATKTFYYLTGDAASLSLAAKLADLAGALKHADADKVVLYTDATTYERIKHLATHITEVDA